MALDWIVEPQRAPLARRRTGRSRAALSFPSRLCKRSACCQLFRARSSRLDRMTEPQLTLLIAAVAAAGALVSAIIAVLAKRDSRTSAQASRNSALAAQDAVAEARRANDRNDAMDQAGLNSQVRAALSIQQRNNGRFHFVNSGEVAVRGLRIVDPPSTLVDANDIVDVPIRGEAGDFGVSVGEDDWPTFVMVEWFGLSQAVPIDFARRPPRVWVF